jgi:hypothetical protein
MNPARGKGENLLKSKTKSYAQNDGITKIAIGIK